MCKMNGKVERKDKKRIDKTKKIILELSKYNYQNERKIEFDITKKDEKKFKNYSEKELDELNIKNPNKYLDEILTYETREKPLFNNLKSDLMLSYIKQNKHDVASDIKWDLDLFFGADLDNLNNLEKFVYETIMNKDNIDFDDKDQRDNILLDAFNNTKHINYSFEEILDSYTKTKENSLNVFKVMRTYFEELKKDYKPSFIENIFGSKQLKKIDRFLDELPTNNQVEDYKTNIRNKYESSKIDILKKHEMLKENYNSLLNSA